MFEIRENSLYYSGLGQWVKVMPWGENSFRVMASGFETFSEENWALTEKVKITVPEINIAQDKAVIKNGKIYCEITKYGKLSFYNSQKQLLLKEYWRDFYVMENEYDSALEINGREFKGIIGGDYSLKVRFEPNENEKIFGMGQYQQNYFDLKGCDIELAHRNSQASVPFYISSKGYGFLWNNPSVGNVFFAKNHTTWYASSTKCMDYWICAGDSPKEIERQYTDVTGKTPMMPEHAMGFWQCKLRYRTQQEILDVVREYKKRNIPLSVIVVDFFHWPHLGDFRFDEKYWPNPKEMVEEIKSCGVEPVVSIWPYVESKSENYEEMRDKGYLTKTEKGLPILMNYMGQSTPFDATNPMARKYVWDKVKKNYYDLGIKTFWLDEAEPENAGYFFENIRYFKGANIQVGNIYPVEYAKGFYEGMEQSGQKDILNLVRCAWAGSQKYGALVWSGDVHSSFESFKQQICAGLSMSVSGIHWWTTDIGGFSGGDPTDPQFRELLVRWFQYGTFCPVMRLHGNRIPYTRGVYSADDGCCGTGADNEIWSFGQEVYNILKPYIFIRESLKPYIREVMEMSHKYGDCVMRPLFYQFPEDETCWDIQDSYMFGDKILVCPITDYKCREKTVYLPKGKQWTDVWSKKVYDGGVWVKTDAPIEQIPLFVTDDFDSDVITDAAYNNGL